MKRTPNKQVETRWVQGRHTTASYLKQHIASYRDNPFIEALPPILTESQAIQALARYPDYDEKDRMMPGHLRLHLIQTVLGCFVPLPVHLDLEQRFSRMIRGGYVRRNPRAFQYWLDLDEACAELGKSSATAANSADPPSLGFTIIGFPGVGKSTSVESILSLYPQVIYHSRYAGRDFNLAQLVWLKLECPFDGSPRGLCINFFHAIDLILGTNYFLNYAGRGRTTDDLLAAMARLITIHGLGVLVIDEINRLSGLKGVGMKLLSFFVQLTNSMRVPIVLIGTYKAKMVLAGEFHQIRRGTGQGDLVWDRMEEGEWADSEKHHVKGSTKVPGVWQLLLESLWPYQYTRVRCPLTKELSEVLYEETQGITDFVAKIYMLSQIRAILTARTPDEELLTPDIIRSVARDSLRQAQPVLAALRGGNEDALSELPDLRPVPMDGFIRNAKAEMDKKDRPFIKADEESMPEIVPYGLITLAKRNRKKGKKKQRPEYARNDLRTASKATASNKTCIFETLQQTGQIASPTEYLDSPEEIL